MTFSKSAEGLIAIACIIMSKMLGVKLSARMKMFGLALGASLLEAMLSADVIMIDGSVKSGIHIIGIVGEGKKDFFLNMHERGVDIIEAFKKSIKGDGR